MIGQTSLLKVLKDTELAPFTMLVGQKGSGRKTLIRELYPEAITISDCSVDSVRQLIDDAYRSYNQIFFVPDVDGMSVNAMNALLKVVEEPPNGNKFIMTIESITNTLTTITSRARVYYMEPYSYSDLVKYSRSKNYSLKYFSLCDTPGEIDLLNQLGADGLYDYCVLVFRNIADVSISNSYKIANRVALKDGEEGYDLKLFWKFFIHVCNEEARQADNREECISYYTWSSITRSPLDKLYSKYSKSMNKRYLFDDWIEEIRWTRV